MDFAGALRARSGWPRRCAAKQRDELAPLAVDMGLPPEPERNHKTRALSLPRVPGKIAEILPVSGVYAGTQQQQLLTRDRPATQIARVRFAPDALPPPLNSTVYVHMHYTRFSAWVANVLVRVF